MLKGYIRSIIPFFIIAVFGATDSSAGSISGNVQEIVTESPISKATITVVNIRDESVVAESETDRNGKYLIENIPLGIYDISVSKKGFADQTKKGIFIARGKETSDVNFRLAHCGTIQGRITEEDGITPIVGAQITLLDAQKNLVDKIIKTDKKGTYRIDQIGVGTYFVMVRADGFATVGRENVLVKAGKTTEVDFSLSVSGSISGTVYREIEKIPIKGARIIAFSDECYGQATCDEFGKYIIKGLKAGEYKVKVIDPCPSCPAKRADMDFKSGIKVITGRDTSGIDFYLPLK